MTGIGQYNIEFNSTWWIRSEYTETMNCEPSLLESSPVQFVYEQIVNCTDYNVEKTPYPSLYETVPRQETMKFGEEIGENQRIDIRSAIQVLYFNKTSNVDQCESYPGL